jgi:hypothetical protein
LRCEQADPDTHVKLKKKYYHYHSYSDPCLKFLCPNGMIFSKVLLLSSKLKYHLHPLNSSLVIVLDIQALPTDRLQGCWRDEYVRPPVCTCSLVCTCPPKYLCPPMCTCLRPPMYLCPRMCIHSPSKVCMLYTLTFRYVFIFRFSIQGIIIRTQRYLSFVHDLLCFRLNSLSIKKQK